MASKILVDELAPYSHATDVTLATGKNITGANTQFKITGGANTNVLTTDGSGGLTWAVAASVIKRSVLCEQQTSGTDGGTFTAGSWVIRTLNNEIFDDIGITITANVFELPAGTFYIKWQCPAYAIDSHMTSLYDVTTPGVVEYGTSGRDDQGAYMSNNHSFGWAKVVNASINQYRIEHRCSTTRATDGLGQATSLSVEKYTIVEIEQHA